jgi:glyoxylase-like metal-dependent hydrolase (beta-lactamase superfamily II)
MLYDSSADVIRKALRGLNLAPSQAATRANLSERTVIAASREPADAGQLAALASALGLDPKALAQLENYQPSIQSIASIERLKLTFDQDGVNAWLCDAGEGRHLLFDTGAAAHELREALDRRGLQEVDVLITHDHADHTGGLRGLAGRLRSARGPGTATPLHPGDHFSCGKLAIRVIALPGHCDGALGYVVTGPEAGFCVTGDALFAGSIGGCAPGEPYRQALAALRAGVMSLPPDTLLLPGHGPATTVALESHANPFLAGPA